MNNDQEKRTIFSYSNIDGKVFVYTFREDQIQKIAKNFTDDIFFELTEGETKDLIPEAPTDNLGSDFIYYQPRTSGRCIMLCTCNNFLESDEPTDAGINRLAKKAVIHARKSGHTLNPRGN